MPIKQSGNADQIVKLQSKEGEVFEIKRGLIERQSVFFKNLFSDAKEDEVVPLDRFPSETVSTIVRWCEEHANAQIPSSEEELNNDRIVKQLTADEEKLLSMESGKLAELLKAAHFLEITTLLNAACKVVAKQIEALGNTEAIKKYLNL
uniref:Skp1-related protein n=1 Tax=Steinernema glaseri TaxID=37863 RepID=A0A1I8ASU7_9BILA